MRSMEECSRQRQERNLRRHHSPVGEEGEGEVSISLSSLHLSIQPSIHLSFHPSFLLTSQLILFPGRCQAVEEEEHQGVQQHPRQHAQSHLQLHLVWGPADAPRQPPILRGCWPSKWVTFRPSVGALWWFHLIKVILFLLLMLFCNHAVTWCT